MAVSIDPWRHAHAAEGAGPKADRHAVRAAGYLACVNAASASAIVLAAVALFGLDIVLAVSAYGYTWFFGTRVLADDPRQYRGECRRTCR